MFVICLNVLEASLTNSVDPDQILDQHRLTQNLDHSGKSATIRESNHGSGVCKEHYALYYDKSLNVS